MTDVRVDSYLTHGVPGIDSRSTAAPMENKETTAVSRKSCYIDE